MKSCELLLKQKRFINTKYLQSSRKYCKENFNEMNIQMLNNNMRKQLFPNEERKYISENKIEKCKEDLKKYDLWNEDVTPVKTPNIKLPPLKGKNIDEHFRNIALDSSLIYLNNLQQLASCNLPEMPPKWSKKSGWTKYTTVGKKVVQETVEFPNEEAMVFDCEVLVPLGDEPIMAVSVSRSHWYSWTSKRIQSKTALKKTSDLIPLETTSKDRCINLSNSIPKIVVGHNVSYDRARIKEQFYFKESKIRFVDTLSMHVAIGGLISTQQQIAMSRKKLKESLDELGEVSNSKDDWLKVGSLNNLSDVHNLYCGTEISKDARNVFVKGTLNNVRLDFQNLMKYCANDVASTHNVLKAMLPIFHERFPHSVTFAGMIEMGQMILPINSNWNKYIESSELAYQELLDELQHTISQFAKEACHKFNNAEYKTDSWLWDLDWETQNIKLLKLNRKNVDLPLQWFNSKPNSNIIKNNHVTESELISLGKSNTQEFEPSPYLTGILKNCYKRLPKINKKLPGYPKWYRELCLDENDIDWKPGPVELSPLKRIVPKLLNITWKGFPLHFVTGHGWGFLVDKNHNFEEQSHDKLEFESDENNIEFSVTSKFIDVTDIPFNKNFYKIVHKESPRGNIGSVFGKSMQSYVESGYISSASQENAVKCLKINAACSYWRLTRSRLASQVINFHKKSSLPKHITNHIEYDSSMQYGSILPIVAVSGTITRRAVEKTWLTASNIIYSRIGSELKSMVCAPPGYCFVGADVDSEELWIASLLGDTISAGVHGCTPLSWMTLQGDKSSGTDMHSKTAAAIGITRDQAKAFNYGRIYGGGKNLALMMMKSYNPSLKHNEAVKKVQTLFKITKGQLKYKLSMQGRWYAKKLNLKHIIQQDTLGKEIDEKEVYILLTQAKEKYGFIEDIKWSHLVSPGRYFGGMESDMFNKLSEIANNDEPETPVLNCRLSRALEPSLINTQYRLSRNNWVVQSSAVDYLHLLIVCMSWLIKEYKLDARFAISIHDELRYLCHEDDKYKVALALQISNLLTRTMFAYKVGMDDLPHVVSYFSSVEIDKVIRKDVNDDCKTLSNPMGLLQTYGIPSGESLTIEDIIEKTNNCSFK